MAGCGDSSPGGPDFPIHGVPSTVSPPSSPMPTPNHLEVPGTPLRNTPQSAGRRRSALVQPLVLFPEAIDFSSNEMGLVRTKRKLQERLAFGGERLPLNFNDRLKSQKFVEQSTHTMDDFESRGEIGRGSYGTVKKVVMRDSSCFAMKLIERHVSGPKQARFMVQKERQAHALLRDKTNIVQSPGFGHTDNSSFLLTELCEGGSLAMDIENRRSTLRHYDEAELIELLKHMATGLLHMHEAQLVHCDVKPANVFIKHVNGRPVYKIGDLGNTFFLENRMQELDAGDSKYLAPECLQRVSESPLRGCDVRQQDIKDFTKIDMFSLGVSMLEAATLAIPPSGGDDWESLRRVGPRYLERYSDSFNRVLSRAPSDRPTCSELLDCLNLPTGMPLIAAPLVPLATVTP